MTAKKATGVYLSQKNLRFKKQVVDCLQANCSLAEVAAITGYKKGSFSKKVVALFSNNYSDLKKTFISDTESLEILEDMPQVDDLGVVVDPHDDKKFSLLIARTNREDKEQAAWMQMVQNQIQTRRLMVALAYPRQ